MSTFTELAPLLLDERIGYQEPSVHSLSKKAKNSLARLEVKRQELEGNGNIASGDTVGIISSGHNAWGRWSDLESEEHALSAERIARSLKSIGVINVELVEGATLEDVLRILKDPEISDLMYIGHSERSNLILDKTATWRTLAEEMTHLKHSIGVIGCSTSFKDTISPRLGTLLLPDNGLLYGKTEGVTRPSEQGNLTNFVPLDRTMSDFQELNFDQFRSIKQAA